MVRGTPGTTVVTHQQKTQLLQRRKYFFTQDKELRYYQNPTLESYCRMRGTDPEVLRLSLTPKEPQIWTLHLVKVDQMSSQHSTAPKRLDCSVEKSQRHRSVPHIRCTFIVSRHVTKWTHNIALSLSPQNWIRIEKIAPKIHLNLPLRLDRHLCRGSPPVWQQCWRWEQGVQISSYIPRSLDSVNRMKRKTFMQVIYASHLCSPSFLWQLATRQFDRW